MTSIRALFFLLILVSMAGCGGGGGGTSPSPAGPTPQNPTSPPRLNASNLTVNPTVANPDDNVTVKFSISNAGDQEAKPSEAIIAIVSSKQDVVTSWLLQTGTIGAGKSAEYSVVLKVPNLATGSYKVAVGPDVYLTSGQLSTGANIARPLSSLAQATYAYADMTVTAGYAPVNIEFSNPGNQYLGASDLQLVVNASFFIPTITSTSPSVCSVSGQTLHLTGVGECFLTARIGGGFNWAMEAATISFNVLSAGGLSQQSIDFPAIGNQTLDGITRTLIASASSGLPVSFASSSTSVCTVSGSSLVLVAVGTCTINATQAGNSTYAAAQTKTTSFSVIAQQSTGLQHYEGVWRNPSNNTTFRYALVEPDGKFWGFPLTEFASATNFYADTFGVTIVGRISASNGTVTGTYYNIAAPDCDYSTCTVAGLSAPGTLFLEGKISGSGASLTTWSMNLLPDAVYSVPAAFSQVAGTWKSSALMPGPLGGNGTLTVAANGAVAVNNIGGCAFAGTLSPVSGKGYFRLNVTSVAGTCSSGVTPSQVVGVAYRTVEPGYPDILRLMWHSPDYKQAFWSAGAR